MSHQITTLLHSTAVRTLLYRGDTASQWEMATLGVLELRIAKSSIEKL